MHTDASPRTDVKRNMCSFHFWGWIQEPGSIKSSTVSDCTCLRISLQTNHVPIGIGENIIKPGNEPSRRVDHCTSRDIPVMNRDPSRRYESLYKCCCRIIHPQDLFQDA